MMDRDTRWARVVPAHAFADVAGQTDAMTIGIGIAAEDVDEAP